MYFKIFIVIQLLCITAVFCRTNLDVINDFEPIFQERHNEFRRIKILFQIETMPYFKSFDIKKLDATNDLLVVLREADEKVNDETVKYLEDREIAIRPERIKHCMNRLKVSKDNVQSFAKGGERVCDQLALKNITEIKEFDKDKEKKLENEHNIIELTRGACIKLRVPYDVQTCIIHDLYTFYLPHIAEVKKAIQIYIQEIGNEVKSGITQNEACFNIVKESAKSDAQNAISDFKVCVWMAV